MNRNQQVCVLIILAIITITSCQTTNEAAVVDSKITSKYVSYRNQHINYVNSLEEKYLPIASVKKILDAAYETQVNIENMIDEYYDQKIGLKSIVNATPPIINETVKTLWEIAKAEEVNIIDRDEAYEQDGSGYINLRVYDKDDYADDDVMPILYVYEVMEMIETDYSYMMTYVKSAEDFYNFVKDALDREEDYYEEEDYEYHEELKLTMLSQIQSGIVMQNERMWNWVIKFGDVHRNVLKWLK